MTSETQRPKCPSCDGTGIYIERHDEIGADEKLGCFDCFATGFADATGPEPITMVENGDWS